ncbi:hypothetical protein C8N32_11051 [Rhodovulum imhoffii]|uniref:NnrS protein n=1 Tax=Rhodovulum imhoffii TaxID=365340 RepID=A0A2T5BR88_9RHOB|nr:hypothetical protein [Rhodovulum imhoffii]PTN01770.1 hypothetical protein C8N32_11051 [Rhodovulum imhoffii]
MIWSATWVRLAAPVWFPPGYDALLRLAAVLWCLGWGAFALSYLPALPARPAPGL